MPEATKVLYDVSQAIKELNKLNDKVEESGDKAKKAFGTQSINDYDKRLKKLAYTLGGTDFSAKGLLTTIGGSAAVFTAAAGSVASVAANLLDLKTLLRDTTANFTAFANAVENIRQTRETISALGDVAAQRDLELASRAVRLDQADLRDEQNSVERARDASRERLEIIKDEVRRREQIVKDGVKREQSLRDKLADRTATSAADSFGGPTGKRALDLGAAARRAAFEGEIQLAEELEAAARAAGEEAGNHSLFLKDQESTTRAINQALQRQINQQGNANNENQNQLDRVKQLEAALAGDLKANENKLKLIQQQNRELSRQKALIRDATLEQRNTEQADTGARQVQTGSQVVSQFFQQGRSAFERFSDTIDNIQQAVGGGAGDHAAVDTLQANLIEELAGLGKLARTIQQGGNVSAADIAEQSASFEKISKLLEILNQGEAEGRLDGNNGAQAQLEQLNTLFNEGIKKIFEGATDFRRVRGDDTNIREGSVGPTRDDMRGLRDAVLGLTKAIPDIVNQADSATAASTNAANSTGAPQQAASAAPITVNANVKGGIIDEEVVNKITEIIRRELRKQTAAKTSSE